MVWWIGSSSRADQRSRIVDAVENGYREAGEVIFETAPRDGDGDGEALASERLRFSQRFECKNDGSRYEEPEPRLFSFNNPYGACPRCQGFGNTIDFDLDLVIPDKGKTLNEGAIEPWTKPKYRPLFTELKRFARPAGIPLDVPWYELEAEQQRLIVDGETRVSAGCAASFSIWSARSTSCTSACFSAAIADIRCARLAEGLGCARRRVR